MTAYKDLPDTLKPYQSHGVNFEYDPKEKDTKGECPWCGSATKFAINVTKGTWKCWVCAEGSDKGGGNVTTFLRLLWERSCKSTTEEQYSVYAKDKGFIYTQTLKDWGLVFNTFNRRWMVPGYGLNTALANLYTLSPIKNSDGTYSHRWLPTHGAGMRIFGLNLFVPEKPLTYVCEGFHDGAILYETLKYAKIVGDRLEFTEDPTESLLAEANVLAIPGALQWQVAWTKLVEGKEVRLMLDNDHPTQEEGKPNKLGAGILGTKRTAGLMYGAKTPVESIEALVWGPEGHEPSLPDGYDVRDFLLG